MKEETIALFKQKGTRLQLLKITGRSVNGYFQIRENRKIITTFTTLDTAIRKYYGILGNKILQKNIFSIEENELIQDQK